MTGRIFRRLFAGALLLAAGGAALTGWLAWARASEALEEEARERLRREAEALRVWAARSEIVDGTRVLRDVSARTGLRYTLLAADGRVLADSGTGSLELGDLSRRPEILSARSHGIGFAQGADREGGPEAVHCALPWAAEGSWPGGYVRVSLSLEALGRDGDLLGACIRGAWFRSVLVSLPLAFLLAWRLAHPITRLTEAAVRISRGEYEGRAPTQPGGELGDLAAAVNRMARALQAHIGEQRAERGELQAVFSAMAEGLLVADAQERIVHVNDGMARLLGLPAAKETGRALEEATRVSGILDAVDRAAREGQVVRAEIQILGGPRARRVALRAAPLPEGQGVALLAEDVTELRRLEQVRRDFVANVSHELNTPIAAMRGLLETDLDDPAMPPTQRTRFLGRLREQVLRMQFLVADLLALAQAESSERALEPPAQELDLRAVLRQAAEVFAPQAAAKGLVWGYVEPASPLRVLGDVPALRRVIDNLLQNAITYTGAGGRVDLRAGERGAEAWVEVVDTGVGIAPADQERVFERFYRVDQARSRAAGGTGLGLSIVKHTVAALGGRVELESEPGRGSTFRVWLASDARVRHGQELTCS